MGAWLLIKPVNSVETVDNAIAADETTAQTYLSSNGGDYDYVLDRSLYSPIPNIGWTYDPNEDSFSAPPIDYVQIMRAEIDTIDAVLKDALSVASNLSPEDLAEAISQGLSDIEGGYTETEEALFAAIVTYLTNGG